MPKGGSGGPSPGGHPASLQNCWRGHCTACSRETGPSLSNPVFVEVVGSQKCFSPMTLPSIPWIQCAVPPSQLRNSALWSVSGYLVSSLFPLFLKKHLRPKEVVVPPEVMQCCRSEPGQRPGCPSSTDYQITFSRTLHPGKEQQEQQPRRPKIKWKALVRDIMGVQRQAREKPSGLKEQ